MALTKSSIGHGGTSAFFQIDGNSTQNPTISTNSSPKSGYTKNTKVNQNQSNSI